MITATCLAEKKKKNPNNTPLAKDQISKVKCQNILLILTSLYKTSYILVEKVPPTHNRLLPKAPNVYPSTCECDCQIQCLGCVFVTSCFMLCLKDNGNRESSPCAPPSSYCFYRKMENEFNPARQTERNPLDLF